MATKSGLNFSRNILEDDSLELPMRREHSDENSAVKAFKGKTGKSWTLIAP
jgi:hypothetical protein